MIELFIEVSKTVNLKVLITAAANLQYVSEHIIFTISPLVWLGSE
jgi:hypothetical protein